VQRATTDNASRTKASPSSFCGFFCAMQRFLLDKSGVQ